MRIIMLVACWLVSSLWASELVTSSLHAKIAFYSFRDGNYEIYTMNRDGSNSTRLTFNEAPDAWPVWSPNGQQIVFHSYRDGNSEIYVMDADGKNQRNLTCHPASDGYPSWSPDGNQIAFDSNRGALEGERKFEIYVMDTNGSNVKQVTNVGWASRPRWSPDGEWILLEAGEIYAIRPDGTRLWQVSNPRPDALMLLGGWSPDGKKVLYTEAVNLNPDISFPFIAALSPQGRQEVISWKPVKVPRMPFDTSTFSADGKSILFCGETDDTWNIYRFELIGNQLIQLTDNPGDDAGPQEWNSRLSVSPQGMLPQSWGRIKALYHKHFATDR